MRDMTQTEQELVAMVVRLTGERDAARANLRVALRALKTVEKGGTLSNTTLAALDLYRRDLAPDNQHDSKATESEGGIA